MRLSKAWLLAIAMVVVVVVAVLFRLQAPNTKAMKFVQTKIKNSLVVQSRIGDVSDVKLKLFGTYRAKYSYPMFDSGESERVKMDVDAVGNKGNAVIGVEVVGNNDVWKIENATMNGKPIVLD